MKNEPGRLKPLRNRDCLLPFTWANWSVHGSGIWCAKFRTVKFRPGIAFTICTNQFYLPENDREGLKLVSKIALEKWKANFCLEYSVRKNSAIFSDVPLLPGIFRWNEQIKSCSIYFPTRFSGIFL